MISKRTAVTLNNQHTSEPREQIEDRRLRVLVAVMLGPLFVASLALFIGIAAEGIANAFRMSLDYYWTSLVGCAFFALAFGWGFLMTIIPKKSKVSMSSDSWYRRARFACYVLLIAGIVLAILRA